MAEAEKVEEAQEVDPGQLDFEDFISDFISEGSTAEEIPADSPEEDAVAEDEVVEEEEVVEEAEAEEEAKEEEEKAPTEVEALRAQLAEMAKQLQALQQGEVGAEPKVDNTLEAEEFVQEEAFDEALTSAEGMNKLLQGVYTKAVATAREEFIKQVPNLVAPMVTDIVNRTQMVNEFYTKNKDLVNMKDYVGYVAKEIASKNPEFTLPKVLDSVAVEVRKRMGLTGDSKGKPKANTGLPKPRTTRQPSPKQLKGMEAEIADLLGF